MIENQTAAYITGLTHRIRLPKTRIEGEKHPVLLLIHGRHGNEDVPWIFARNIPDDWIIISPRAIEFEPESDEHEIGYSWIEMPESGWPNLDAFEGAVQAIADFVEALPDTYNADEEKIIALGFSQGAATALATATLHPNLFKGIASLVGFYPEPSQEQLDQKPLAKLPVFFAVGDRDERIPLDISQWSMRTLKASGAVDEANIYSVGHKLNSQGMKDLSSWLKTLMNEIDGVEA